MYNRYLYFLVLLPNFKVEDTPSLLEVDMFHVLVSRFILFFILMGSGGVEHGFLCTLPCR